MKVGDDFKLQSIYIGRDKIMKFDHLMELWSQLDGVQCCSNMTMEMEKTKKGGPEVPCIEVLGTYTHPH